MIRIIIMIIRRAVIEQKVHNLSALRACITLHYVTNSYLYIDLICIQSIFLELISWLIPRLLCMHPGQSGYNWNESDVQLWHRFCSNNKFPASISCASASAWWWRGGCPSYWLHRTHGYFTFLIFLLTFLWLLFVEICAFLVSSHPTYYELWSLCLHCFSCHSDVSLV